MPGFGSFQKLVYLIFGDACNKDPARVLIRVPYFRKLPFRLRLMGFEIGWFGVFRDAHCGHKGSACLSLTCCRTVPKDVIRPQNETPKPSQDQ